VARKGRERLSDLKREDTPPSQGSFLVAITKEVGDDEEERRNG